MPPVPPATAFENPLTGTTYRLVVNGASWRITKVTPGTDGSTVIRHLRGLAAPGINPPAKDVDRLVRGEHQVHQFDADPALAFAEAVLLDLDRTASWLSGMASAARRRTATGAPGFRAGCGALRQQDHHALDMAVGGCRKLGDAWMALEVTVPPTTTLPVWLAKAVEDRQAVAAAL